MNLFNIRRTFKDKQTKGWPEIYVLVDLHGTIIPGGKSTSDKNDYLEFYPVAKEVLQLSSGRVRR